MDTQIDKLLKAIKANDDKTVNDICLAIKDQAKKEQNVSDFYTRRDGHLIDRNMYQLIDASVQYLGVAMTEALLIDYLQRVRLLKPKKEA